MGRLDKGMLLKTIAAKFGVTSQLYKYGKYKNQKGFFLQFDPAQVLVPL